MRCGRHQFLLSRSLLGRMTTIKIPIIFKIWCLYVLNGTYYNLGKPSHKHGVKIKHPKYPYLEWKYTVYTAQSGYYIVVEIYELQSQVTIGKLKKQDTVREESVREGEKEERRGSEKKERWRASSSDF